ncbi:hypothetical protein Salmuc_01711 [Salipiger mucosus DSM 16094]|uniref:Uncharacterized protein n=2 Tax=Salipiger mucosus TaxID=263378 RepID=S9QRA1_9RHOB|nr:hypothetical protein Salmuc_01711 [Salipiger mucosus DSM 16094]
MLRMRLTDLYDMRDLDDDEEMLFHAVSDDALEFDFEVRTMPAGQITTVKTALGDLTVVEAMEALAEDWQHELIAFKRENFDEDRVVILEDDRIIDGNHHLVAAHLEGRDLRYIQLTDAPEPAPPRP